MGEVTVLGDNTDTIKKNTEAVTVARKEVGLEGNTEKIKYIYVADSSPDCGTKS
jgi:hypothetical protein